MMFLWFIIIGFLVYVLIGKNLDLHSLYKKSPNDQLNERLAKGEISIEEYHKIKSTLKEEANERY